MTQQSLPFFESDKAATKYAIQSSGKTPKAVAHALWPNKTVDRAQTDLLNALNDGRDEQLSTDEHIFVATYCGQFDWLFYVCHRCAHSRPVAQSPEEVSAQLQAALFQKADELDSVIQQIRQMRPKPQMRAVA